MNTAVIYPETGLEKAFPVILSGQLSIFSFIDIIQMVANSRQSGRLAITNKNATVYIYFEKGEVVDAESEYAQGEEAFFSILSIEDGSFEFSACKSQNSSLKRTNTTQLLLEALRRIDESHRDGADAQLQQERRSSSPQRF